MEKFGWWAAADSMKDATQRSKGNCRPHSDRERPQGFNPGLKGFVGNDVPVFHSRFDDPDESGDAVRLSPFPQGPV